MATLLTTTKPFARASRARRGGGSLAPTALCMAALFAGCSGEMTPSGSENPGHAGDSGSNGAKAGTGSGGTAGSTPSAGGGAGSGSAGAAGAPAAAGSGGSPSMPAAEGTGILDCPAVTAPAYTLAAAGGKLSARFQGTCAGCHGENGVGRPPGYPAIPGSLTLDQYKATIRSGKGLNMPAFDVATISDADIAADYAVLKGGSAAAATPVTNARTRPETWDDAKLAAVMKRGIELLRKPDRYGTACANCHSADAIELGVIAFTDDDVLRRALQHVTSDDALDLVDYVHGLRIKYGIKNPCSKLWRPFQPGGAPLPGATVEEREVAFAAELDKRKLLLVTKPITSLADAKAAFADLTTVDLRKLPVGVTFPRWSEDAFDGAEHKSFNDWMPGGGRVPTNPSTWYARQDKYLADPTIANLAAVHAAVEKETTLSKADSHGREISANFSTAYDAQGWMEETLRLKYESVQVGAHFFRMALLGKPGWFERPALPFPELPREIGPFFHQGLHNAESPCYSNETCDAEVTSRLPEFMKDEFGKQTVTSMALDTLSDPWSYLGQLMDQTLLTAENTRGPTQDGHYWNEFTFEHRLIQQPFFSAHRLAMQETYATKMRGTDKFPATLESALRSLPKVTHPILHSEWTDLQGIAADVRSSTDKRLPASMFLRANIALMYAYLQREQLQAGQPVDFKDKLLNHIDAMRAPAQQLQMLLGNATFAGANPRLKDNSKALVTDALKLIDEVAALAKAAPEMHDPWDAEHPF